MRRIKKKTTKSPVVSVYQRGGRWATCTLRGVYEEVRQYDVKGRDQDSAGYIYLPRTWIGRKIAVVLLKEE